MLKKILNTNHYVYFIVQENIKMENAPILYEEFVKENNYFGKKIFFDFSKITFVDSSGIGVLIRCSEYLKDRSSHLVIVGINKSMQTVFRLAGLNQIFDIIDIKDLTQYFTKDELEIFKEYR